MIVSGHSQSSAYSLPFVTTLAGAVTSIYQCATSIQCVIRSVSAPPPKSQNQRHQKNLIGVTGCSEAFRATLV